MTPKYGKEMERCGTVVKRRIQDRELVGSTQASTNVVSLSKTLYPHCLVLVSTQEDMCIILIKDVAAV